MAKNWQQGKQWSDRFLPEIKAHLGVVLISEAPIYEDMMHNTDLMVLRLESVRIGCRVRQYEYLNRYGDEFTIRAELSSGKDTELQKILAGWGDYFFYGFANAKPSTTFATWRIGDLEVFRRWYREYVQKYGDKPGFFKRNTGPNDSSFRAFRWDAIPGFEIARSESVSPTPPTPTPPAPPKPTPPAPPSQPSLFDSSEPPTQHTVQGLDELKRSSPVMASAIATAEALGGVVKSVRLASAESNAVAALDEFQF